MRQMNRMLNNMNNMLTDPFGGMFGGGGNDMMGMGMGLGMMNMAMSPMAMMNPMMQMTRQQPGLPGMNFNRLTTGAPGMSFSSSSVYSVSSSGPNGRPQVYQETRSIRNGPDGVREQIETVQDSVSGKKKMSIGHHIGERGHVLEKEQNLHTGEREEREELINLDEDETDEFERDFSNRTRQLASGSRRQCRIEEISSQPLPAIQSYVIKHPHFILLVVADFFFYLFNAKLFNFLAIMAFHMNQSTLSLKLNTELTINILLVHWIWWIRARHSLIQPTGWEIWFECERAAQKHCWLEV